MQELKPVAWRYQHEEKPELVNVTDVRLNSETRNPLYEESPLYALPDTHRIVSLELLERVHQFAALAAEHYSGMNDEVCQSYSEPWQQGVAMGKELKAIIDKEPTK